MFRYEYSKSYYWLIHNIQVEKARQSLYQEKMQLTQTKLQRALTASTQNKIVPSPSTAPTIISPSSPLLPQSNNVPASGALSPQITQQAATVNNNNN